MTELNFTPEMIFTLPSLGSDTTFSVAPSLLCRYTTGRVDVDECGAGLGLALGGASRDGLRSYGIAIDYNDTGTSRQTSAEVNVSFQF